MENPLFSGNGMPDINAIRQRFPAHGTGRIDHRSSLGDDYAFEIYRDGGGYVAQIILQPSYRGKASGAHEAHWLPLGDGSKRICFKNTPTDLPTTVTLTLWWAECTSRYIRDGGSWR